MYTLSCINCRRDFDIEDSQAGTFVFCPWCEVKFRVPEGDDFKPATNPKKRRRLKAKRQKGYSVASIRTMITGGCVTGLGIILLGIGLGMMAGPGGKVGARFVGYGGFFFLAGMITFAVGVFGGRD